MKTRLLPLLVLLAAAVFAAPAWAGNPDPAQTLFDHGIADLEAGRFEKACPAIEQSYQLDPRPGTLFTLAECEAKRGRLATAVQRYDEYLALYATLPADKKQKQGDRERDTRAARATLLPQVPEVTVSLSPSAPRETVVTRDGAPLAQAALGVPLRMDPGEHVFTTRAPGGPATERRITVSTGEKKAVTLDVKQGASTGPAPGPTAPEPPAPGDSGPSGRRVGAFVTTGIGAVGLLIGAITGGLALGKKGTVDANCGASAGFTMDPTACNHTGKTAADSLRALGLVSTVSFALGTAGAVTGVVLFVTEPRAKAASVGLRGAW